MNSFIGFVKKEFYHIIRDYRSLIILFGLPIIELILFGYAIRNELTSAKIGIYDQSNDHVTHEITDKILSSGYFQLYGYLHTTQQVDKAFRDGSVREVIVFGSKFSKKLGDGEHADVQLIADASDPNMSRMLVGYTTSILLNYEQSIQTPGKHQLLTVVPEIRMFYNPELKSVNLFVPGLIAVILMLVSALMTSITITREKEMGTMEILLVSPLKPIQIIVGKVLPYLVLSFVNVMMVLGMALYIFHVPFRGGFIMFISESMLFTITALSLGLFISTTSSSQQEAMMKALAGLLLPTIMLSGFIFPVTSMPKILQWFSVIIPARWFLVIIKGVMLRGVGIQYLWKETLILAVMAIVFLVISMKKFKTRLD
ncbi:MAG TPA: ABC transporter permease [Balneolales bacterium]|nr:ABC transporter permease [Balneolales bacterium]